MSEQEESKKKAQEYCQRIAEAKIKDTWEELKKVLAEQEKEEVCPHCGRGKTEQPAYPAYPYYPTVPYYPRPVWIVPYPNPWYPPYTICTTSSTWKVD